MEMESEFRNLATATGSNSSSSDSDDDKWKKRKVKVTQAIKMTDSVAPSRLDSVKCDGMTLDDFKKTDPKLNSWCTVVLPLQNSLSCKDVKTKNVVANNCQKRLLRAKSSKLDGCSSRTPDATTSRVNKNLHSAIVKRKYSDSDDDDFQEPKNKKRQKKVILKSKDYQCCKANSHNLNNLQIADTRNDLDEIQILKLLKLSVNGPSEYPAYRIDNFSFYCPRLHLCSILNWTLGEGYDIYLQGFINSLVSDKNSEGEYISKIGPVNTITFSGFDNGEKVLVIISTDFADYYLSEPSSKYQSFYEPVLRNGLLFKYTVELLLSDRYATYEDLLEKIETAIPGYGLKPFKVEDLINSATFILDEINNFDYTATEDEYHLATTDCIRHLVDISGISENGSKVNKRNVASVRRDIVRTGKSEPVKATTTPLIHHVMQICDIFQQQISPECTAMQIKEENKEQSVKEGEMMNIPLKVAMVNIQRTCLNKDVMICQPETMSMEWLGSPTTVNGKENVYYSMKSKGKQYKAKDFVFLNSKAHSIAQIVYMFENKKGKQFHAHYFCSGNETLLGDTAAKNELYMTNSCSDLGVDTIIKKVKAIPKIPSPNWRLSGGQQFNSNDENPDVYYYQKWYEKELARFVDLPIQATVANPEHSCTSCFVKDLKTKRQTPVLTTDKQLIWEGTEYNIGDCVYVDSGKPIPKKMQDLCVHPKLNSNIDENKHPEYYRKYRKGEGSSKGSFVDVPQPFLIGRIISFEVVTKKLKSAADVKVELQLFCRPEDTNIPIKDVYKMDYNLLFWTEAENTFRLNQIVRKCYVVFGEQLKNSNSLDYYFSGGPDRFYFLESYNRSKQTTFAVANEVKDQYSKDGSKFKLHPIVKIKLKALDVFCGCGGLSEGFHQSGLTETKWAIENDKEAAKAFQKNNPDAIVFTGDCNDILKQMIEGRTHDNNGKKLPQKGEVDFLKGGPPCQGFSGMNRFNKGEYSLFKNSLIVTYLSYVEYLRPRFFLLENVKTFVSFKKGAVLKSCLRSLREMDYQVTVGILQAGNYGVPQSRQRVFILAAAPNEKLPYFPEPLHTFHSTSSSISFTVDRIHYKNNIREKSAAPFRQMTVFDGISDLSAINEDQRREKIYNTEFQTHFQRMMRKSCNQDKIYDHTSKVSSMINKERFKYIPQEVGADWRDLPNIRIKLPDGTMTEKLKYDYDDKKYGRSKIGAKRGVCPCAEKSNVKVHNRQDQKDTLIPWCLPHTSNRHNDWAGLFGRLSWFGYFGTTITNPEPMGKIGTVVHPEEARVVSVRECARSQGFPDSYKFSGAILKRHRQIGNAVPPPLGKALGLEFAKCLQED